MAGERVPQVVEAQRWPMVALEPRDGIYGYPAVPAGVVKPAVKRRERGRRCLRGERLALQPKKQPGDVVDGDHADLSRAEHWQEIVLELIPMRLQRAATDWEYREQ
jgi:hypothetical protein